MDQKRNAKKNAIIEEEIEKSIQGVNIQELLEAYCSGVHKAHIKMKFSLTDEELLYILKKNVTVNMVRRRNESIDRLKWFNVDVSIKKEEIPHISIQEAIDLVEGKGERE